MLLPIKLLLTAFLLLRLVNGAVNDDDTTVRILFFL